MEFLWLLIPILVLVGISLWVANSAGNKKTDTVATRKGENMIVFVDMDNVLCDYDSSHAAALKAVPENPYPQSQHGFFQKLPPIEGAIEAVAALQAHPKYEVYILTAPSIHNPLSYTEKRIWVEEYLWFPMVERLIISPDKGLLRGDILIDDHLSGNGQDRFDGKLLQFGSPSFPGWHEIKRELQI